MKVAQGVTMTDDLGDKALYTPADLPGGCLDY